MEKYNKADLKFVTIIKDAKSSDFLGYDFVIVEDNGILCTSVLDPEKTYVFHDASSEEYRPTGVTFAEYHEWSLSADCIVVDNGIFIDRNNSEFITRKDLLRWVEETHNSKQLYFLNYQPTEKKGEKTKKYGDKRTFTS